ncbi:Crp/Fnr family transcriptional regulator [Glacieibacterium megasporae]|uniref:Crp/Fnr family transcriptional regulator n=1 Tax=Glacieibacterium megasporae TaxID=2835787 RepID=UPI001C1E0C7C|nr:Crp/Fnr family transcriptional regulator [Polymorphobacter megasporae]UAJ12287.1 Crp/Fnr family transcriptional regulator [Polymorphobacter megasporae]
MDFPRAPPGNLLLAAMSNADSALLAPHLHRIALQLRFNLETPGSVIAWVYFPEGGIVSVVATDLDGRKCEVAMFGREGMSGTAVVLGTEISPHHVYMNIAGLSGLRISRTNLRSAMRASETLTALLLSYVQTFMVQGASTARAAGVHLIEQRIARYLLMCHDRLAGDDICLTHGSISTMLGTRRAGVTRALQGIEVAGLIERLRGRITVIDRAGLEQLAGSCYGYAESEYGRVIGQTRRRGEPFRS